jgi:hypothetical protein
MLRLYAERPAEAIEWVLRTWRKRSSFWPSQSDLDALFNEFAKLQNDQEQANAMEETRKTRERLAAAGLPYGPAQFQTLMSRLLETVKKVPAPELTSKRRNELKEKVAGLSTKFPEGSS